MDAANIWNVILHDKSTGGSDKLAFISSYSGTENPVLITNTGARKCQVPHLNPIMTMLINLLRHESLG